MSNKDRKRHMAYEGLLMLGLLALLLFITRLWPILLLVILGIFAAILRLLFLSSTKVEPVEPIMALPAAPAVQEPTERDMKAIAYVLIQKRITQILEAKYPNVRWIWENARAQEDIFIGNPVYVILNLCRVLAAWGEGAVLSKEQGGTWGLANLPEEYHRQLTHYATIRLCLLSSVRNGSTRNSSVSE